MVFRNIVSCIETAFYKQKNPVPKQGRDHRGTTQIHGLTDHALDSL